MSVRLVSLIDVERCSMRTVLPLALLLAIVAVASPSDSQESFIATLRLDPFSVVSFGDQDVYALPEGSEIQFEFSAAEGKGALGFVIQPRFAWIAPLKLEHEGESLRFTLGRQARGVMRRGDDGQLVIELDA